MRTVRSGSMVRSASFLRESVPSYSSVLSSSLAEGAMLKRSSERWCLLAMADMLMVSLLRRTILAGGSDFENLTLSLTAALSAPSSTTLHCLLEDISLTSTTLLWGTTRGRRSTS